MCKESFENRARASLTADGLQERYVDRRVADYDTIDRQRVIDSRDIDNGLVDTYGLFDLTELSSSVEEQEQAYFEQDNDCDFGDKFLECEFDTKHIVHFMAEVGAEFFEERIDGLKLRVISIFSPSEYNYSTDWCEWEITKNPFETREQLIEKMRELAIEQGHNWVGDDYRYEMYDKIDEYLYEHIAGYYVGDYETLYSREEILDKFKKETL